jgi:hypothetical protein
MAQLTFPITGDGLGLDARVNLEGAMLRALQNAGQPLPGSIAVKGLIDTATSLLSPPRS